MKKGFKYYFVSLILSSNIALSLTGCATGTVENTTISDTSLSENNDPIEVQGLFSLSDSDDVITNYVNYYNNYVIENHFEDRYFTDKELEDLLLQVKIVKQYGVGNVTYDTSNIILKLKENSITYAKEHPEYYSFDDLSYYEKVNLNALNDMIEKALEAYINNLVINGTDYLPQDFMRLSELTIVIPKENYHEKGKLTFAAYEKDDNLMVLYPENILLDSKKNEEYSFYELLFNTISHELNHLRQFDDDNKGVSYDIKENYSFIYESSAESALYNQKQTSGLAKDDIYTYSSERSLELMLLMPTLLDNEKSLDDYYNAIFNSDKNGFAKYFEATTDEDIINFYKLLYEIDASEGRNDFASNYYGDHLNEYSKKDLKELFAFTYSNRIFIKSLESLIETTEKDNLSIEENFLIYQTFENMILANSYTVSYDENADSYSRNYPNSFQKDFNTLREKYFNFLTEYYGLSLEEVLNKYYDSYKYDFRGYYMQKASVDSYKKNDDVDLIDAYNVLDKYPKLKLLYSNKNVYATEYESYSELKR